MAVGPASAQTLALADSGLQEVVDVLGDRLGKAVLLDDRELHPVAYSRQTGPLDAVRTACILGRAAPPPVRDALLRCGIASAEQPLHLRRDPAIEMEARVCVPVVGPTGRWGYLWIIEDCPLSEEQLDEVTSAARRVRAIFEAAAAATAARWDRDQGILAAMVHGDRPAQELAHELEHHGLLPSRPLATCVAELAGGDGDAERGWLRAGLARFERRMSEGFALSGEIDGRVVCVVALHDSALHGSGDGAVGAALRESLLGGFAGTEVAVLVGQGSAFEDLADAPASYRRARVALRAAHGLDRPARCAARWEDLGADRLLALLPGHDGLGDLPAGVACLLAPEHETLRHTLEAFLDRAGDVKATAAALSLHRAGLYHRLRRIEQLAGVDLRDGDDRLLCHMALRFARITR